MNGDYQKYWLWLMSLIAGCFPCHATRALSQQAWDTPQIQVESALVTVPVVVRDAQGRLVNGLPASSFKLFDGGRQVPVSLFLASEDPVKIALLIDTSQSAKTVLKKIKKAAIRFLKQMRPRDLGMVVGFDSDIEVLSPLSSDGRELKDAIKRAEAGGAYTRMHDAVREIVQKRFRTATGRKAIVLLTDGRDQGSHLSAKDLLNVVGSSNTPIYTIFYNVDPRELMKELLGVKPRRGSASVSWKQQENDAAEFLEKIADLSGGRLYASDIKDLDGVFRQISDELRSQYLLGFYPDESSLDGTAHTLVVSVSVPGVSVRNRHSYRSVL